MEERLLSNCKLQQLKEIWAFCDSFRQTWIFAGYTFLTFTKIYITFNTLDYKYFNRLVSYLLQTDDIFVKDTQEIYNLPIVLSNPRFMFLNSDLKFTFTFPFELDNFIYILPSIKEYVQILLHKNIWITFYFFESEILLRFLIHKNESKTFYFFEEMKFITFALFKILTISFSSDCYF